MGTAQKITLGEVRAIGVRRLLVYCRDHRCSHSVIISADRWGDDIRLSDLEPRIVCQVCGQRGAEAPRTLHGRGATRAVVKNFVSSACQRGTGISVAGASGRPFSLCARNCGNRVKPRPALESWPPLSSIWDQLIRIDHPGSESDEGRSS